MEYEESLKFIVTFFAIMMFLIIVIVYELSSVLGKLDRIILKLLTIESKVNLVEMENKRNKKGDD